MVLLVVAAQPMLRSRHPLEVVGGIGTPFRKRRLVVELHRMAVGTDRPLAVSHSSDVVYVVGLGVRTCLSPPVRRLRDREIAAATALAPGAEIGCGPTRATGLGPES